MRNEVVQGHIDNVIAHGEPDAVELYVSFKMLLDWTQDAFDIEHVDCQPMSAFGSMDASWAKCARDRIFFQIFEPGDIAPIKT